MQSKPLDRAQKAALIASAVSLCAPVTMAFEGLVTHPNRDPVGIQEVCYGETHVAMHNYTPQQCADFLMTHERQVYAPPVLDCVPALGTKRAAFASAIDAAYNAGPRNFCKSPMAAAFNRGAWVAGCNAYQGWHTLPGTKAHNGLVRRRAAEVKLCLSGEVAPAPAPVPAPAPAPVPQPAPSDPWPTIIFALIFATIGVLLTLWSIALEWDTNTASDTVP